MTAPAIGELTPAGKVAVFVVPAVVTYGVHAVRPIQPQRHGQVAIDVPLMAYVAFLNLAIMALELDRRQVVVGNERTFPWRHWPDGMGATVATLALDATVALAQSVKSLIFSET